MAKVSQARKRGPVWEPRSHCDLSQEGVGAGSNARLFPDGVDRMVTFTLSLRIKLLQSSAFLWAEFWAGKLQSKKYNRTKTATYNA